MSDLPKGWVEVRLDEIAEVRLGRQRSPKNAEGPGMTPYLRAANVTWRGLALDDVKQMSFSDHERATYALRVGDLLLSEASGSAGEVGKPAVWNDELPGCCFQNTLIRVRPYAPISRFLYYQLLTHAVTGRFIDDARGVGIHHLGADRCSSIEVRLAPRKTREHVVLTLDEQLSRIDVGVASLERVKINLRRYRAAVLKSAVEGRLVPTEAELARREGRSFESGTELLKRIPKPLTRMNARSGDDEGSRAARAAEVLPEGWALTTLASIAELKGGITKGQRRAPTARVRQVPYLRVANVQRGYLDLREMKEIEATDEEISDLRLLRGDVLFNEGGDRDKLGRGWVWSGEIAECIHQNHVFRARLVSADLVPQFVSFYGNSAGQSYFMGAGKQTTNLASINLTKLSLLPVRIPPAAEQRRIVAEVGRLFTALDVIERDVDVQLRRATGLRKSLLKHAFEGKLVPQDPNDEPASELLARIAAERASRAPAASPRRRGPSRKGALAAEARD